VSCDEQSDDDASFIAPGTFDTGLANTLDNANLVTCNDAELFLNLKWHLYHFSDRDMDISLVGNAYPSLTDSKRVRGDLNLMLNWELFNSFFWTINARVDLDTAGTQDDKSLEKSDYQLSTGITWTY
jgi:hypothetical protein